MPNPIRLLLLPCSGYLDRLVWISKDRAWVRFIPYLVMIDPHFHSFLVLYLMSFIYQMLGLSSTWYPNHIFSNAHLEGTKAWVQLCMGEPRAQGQPPQVPVHWKLIRPFCNDSCSRVSSGPSSFLLAVYYSQWEDNSGRRLSNRTPKPIQCTTWTLQRCLSQLPTAPEVDLCQGMEISHSDGRSVCCWRLSRSRCSHFRHLRRRMTSVRAVMQISRKLTDRVLFLV